MTRYEFLVSNGDGEILETLTSIYPTLYAMRIECSGKLITKQDAGISVALVTKMVKS